MASLSTFDEAVEAFRSNPSLANFEALRKAAAVLYWESTTHIGSSDDPVDPTTQGQL